jgi:hypothetical protein
MKRRKLIRVGITLCIVLPLASLISLGCADHIILGENHDTVDPGAAKATVLHANGRAIECWRARSPGVADGREPEAYVLFFVGKADRADRWINAVAGAWGNRPVEVWGMNYPGSGGSDGSAKLQNVASSALAEYDAVKQIAGSRPIFIHAGSFGTTAAIYVAANRPIAGMVLQNPAPLKQLIMGNYGWWNLWILAGPVASRVPAELDSVSNAARCKASAVFISAGADWVIPPSYHKLVIDAYAGEKRVIDMPGMGHDSPLTREAAEALAKDMDWLWQGVGERNQKRIGSSAD